MSLDASTGWAATLLAELVAIVILDWRSSRTFDPLSPPFMFSIFMFMGYLLPYPFMVSGLDPFPLFWPYDYSNQEEAVSKALMLACLAVATFYAGYAVAYRLPVAKRGTPSLLSVPKLVLVGVMYSVLTLVLVSIGVAMLGGFSALIEGLGDRTRLFAGLNYLFSALTLPLGIVLLARANAFDARQAPSLRFWVFTGAAVAAASLLGAKSTLYVFLLSLVAIYHYRGHRIPLPRLAALGVGAFVVLMIYQIFVREFLAVGEVVSVEGSDAGGQFLLYLADQFGANFMQLQCMSILVDAVGKDLAFQHGETLLHLLFAPIPLGLFPDKPLTAPGIFTIALWPFRWFDQGTTLPPGIIGEFFLNFGTAGVAGGSLLWGASYGWGFRRAVVGRAASTGMIAYAVYLALMLHYIRGEFSSVTVLYLTLVIPVWFAAKLSRPAQAPATLRTA